MLMAICSFALTNCRDEIGHTLIEPVLGMEFIRMEKGSFQMGDHEGKEESELLHKVKITRDFWLGKTEVTQGQWNKIMGDRELHPEKPSPFRNEDPDYPVVSISYFDIEAFLKKLNEQSNEYRFRLPTEAEWEYACRAGTQTPFSFGTRLCDSVANYNAEMESEYATPGNYLGHPAAVGSYAPNPWGLHDMHGNAWEWVSDWYAPYTTEDATDPTGPEVGKEKVIRGGSWYFGAGYARSSHRRTHEPQLWGFSIGFRIVCERKD